MVSFASELDHGAFSLRRFRRKRVFVLLLLHCVVVCFQTVLEAHYPPWLREGHQRSGSVRAALLR
jgi:hypothetical protein